MSSGWSRWPEVCGQCGVGTVNVLLDRSTQVLRCGQELQGRMERADGRGLSVGNILHCCEDVLPVANLAEDKLTPYNNHRRLTVLT